VRRPFITPLGSVAVVTTGALLVPISLFFLGSNAFAGGASLALYPMVAVGSALVVGGVIWCRERVLEIPSARIDRSLIYLGRISYGLYVFHVLCLKVVRWSDVADVFPQSVKVWINTGLALSLTILCSAVSYRWLEQPFLRLKRKLAVINSEPMARRTFS
jgi:peptidoglycan/LPS O-acetylase OafA/YrhL